MAKATIDEEGFWVLKGSYINPDLVSYAPPGVKEARKENSSLINKNNILTRDVLFHSPSNAAAFVCGKNINGRKEWKNYEGVELGKVLNFNIKGKVVKSKKSGIGKVNELRRQKTGQKIDDTNIVEHNDRFILKRKNLKALGKIVPKGFMVFKGSAFCLDETATCPDGIKNYRKKLVVEKNVRCGKFIKNVIFSSPSTAAACIIAGTANGLKMWENPFGKTLKDIKN